MTFVTNSVDETRALAQRLGRVVHGGVIAFTGDLGAGKTAFVGGLALGLGIDAEVSSPTFAIVNEYTGGRLSLYHFDMYRITGWDDLYSTGFFDYPQNESVLAVEWSENISAALPEKRIDIDIRRGENDDQRIISIAAVGGVELEDFSD